MKLQEIIKLGQNEVVGIDIGAWSVKTVKVKKTSDAYTLTDAALQEIAACDPKDEYLKQTNTVEAVKDALNAAGIGSKFAVCGVGGPEIAVRSFEFPSLLPDEIDGAVMMEASQVCPFNLEDSTLDYQVVSQDEETISGTLVAATNRAINNKKILVQGASMKTVLMDVDGLAMLNCIGELEKVDPSQVLAVLNVGHSNTTLAINGTDGLPFVRDIAFAAANIIHKIAGDNDLTMAKTKDLLLGNETPQSDFDLRGSLEKACGQLVTDVTNSIRYYNAGDQNATIDKIYLCGGFSLIDGLTEILNSRLTPEIVRYNPLEKMNGDETLKQKIYDSGPALVVAAGLAMRTF